MKASGYQINFPFKRSFQTHPRCEIFRLKIPLASIEKILSLQRSGDTLYNLAQTEGVMLMTTQEMMVKGGAVCQQFYK